MRGDGFARPVFSTYAVGAAPLGRPRASAGALGRNFAFPAAAMLGTVSALAAVFASSELEIQADSSPTAERGTPAIEVRPGRRLGNSAIEPGFSFEAVRSQSTEHNAVWDAELPRPAGQARVTLRAVHGASRPGQTAVAPTGGRPPLKAPAYRCVANCSAIDDGLPEASLQSDVIEADRGLLETAGGYLADIAPIPDIAAGGENAPDFAAVGSVAGAAPGSELRAVAESVSAVPAGELMATGADAPTAAELQTDPAASGPDLATFQADDSGDVDTAAAGQTSSLPTETVEESHRNAPSDAIALHLRRIGKRYSSAPLSEPGIATDKIEEGSGRLATRPGASPPQVSLAVDAAGDAVVIRDDTLVAIQLGELVSLFEDRLDRPLFVWMRSSAAAAKFATSETLAAAGIRTEYDAQRQQIVFSVEGD